LIGTKQAALLEQVVNQGGLPVVDMSDDSYIPELFISCHFFFLGASPPATNLRLAQCFYHTGQPYNSFGCQGSFRVWNLPVIAGGTDFFLARTRSLWNTDYNGILVSSCIDKNSKEIQ
jgi:hypothetical protein